ncbi:class I SAM-dependent methyltransferase [Pseudonocardia oroxyli]|uniref:Methyltransferase domain-containing protein n=1 Tax=Pseudonocardia oroxyli TaxID=366584 RepID=A0A1G7IFK6_PSEOR|nr:class I SAM-dependent methyltransferase [Pseudonocardia oroxyli]SDF11530.1 Methyltransferase domain-containing protein [Pseudonocardia oroxyli]
MSTADRERWDARHAAVGLGTPMPPDGLRGRESLLPGAGRALDLACGRGAVAVWAAQRGLAVDAVDVSPAAVRSGRALAGAVGVRAVEVGETAAPGEVRFAVADLDAWRPPEGVYALVVCQRFRDPALYPALAAALAPDGLLVVTVLSEVDDEPGRFRARPGELRTAFGHLDVLADEERNGEATLVARRP